MVLGIGESLQQPFRRNLRQTECDCSDYNDSVCLGYNGEGSSSLPNNAQKCFDVCCNCSCSAVTEELCVACLDRDVCDEFLYNCAKDCCIPVTDSPTPAPEAQNKWNGWSDGGSWSSSVSNKPKPKPMPKPKPKPKHNSKAGKKGKGIGHGGKGGSKNASKGTKKFHASMGGSGWAYSGGSNTGNIDGSDGASWGGYSSGSGGSNHYDGAKINAGRSSNSDTNLGSSDCSAWGENKCVAYRPYYGTDEAQDEMYYKCCKEYRTAAATSRERVSASGNIASIYSVVSSSQGSDKNNTYNNSSHHSDTVSSSTSSHSSSVANLSSSALASVTSGIFGTTLGIVVCALVISATLAIVVGITRRKCINKDDDKAEALTQSSENTSQIEEKSTFNMVILPKQKVERTPKSMVETSATQSIMSEISQDERLIRN